MPRFTALPFEHLFAAAVQSMTRTHVRAPLDCTTTSHLHNAFIHCVYIAANEPRKAFAKPTTSYLKKTTTKAVSTPSPLPKRPSSVASNCSTTSNSLPLARSKPLASVASSTLRSAAATAKRSPTITLLSSAASCKSGQSSRRSSITSPSKVTGPLFRKEEPSKAPDAAHQLRHLQALCQQQTQRISLLEGTQSALRSSAFLALNAHLINEVSE